MNCRNNFNSRKVIIPIILALILLINYPASAQEGTIKWSIDIGVKGEGISSPVVGTDGTIYVESGDDLYAINPDSTQKWVLNRAGIPQAIGEDGTIYAGSLYAINPNGTQKWELTGVGSAQAIGADGIIYTRDGPSLYAINPDGTRKWVYTIDIIGLSPFERYKATIIGADGTIYTVIRGYYCHPIPPCSVRDYIFAINPDGTYKWNFETSGLPAGGGSPVIGSDGTIYAIMAGCSDNCLYAVNPDGSEKWGHHHGAGYAHASSLTIGVDDTIYFQADIGPGDDSACDGGLLIAVNPDATTKWCDDMMGPGWAPAVGDDGTIYAGPADSAMHAFNPDGTKKWELNLCSGGSELAIGADGTIYAGFGDCDGQPSLKAINSSSTGLANSSWPMFMHDARHTGRAIESGKENLLYTAVTPCRIVDTRKTSAGMIRASTDRDFHVFGDSSTISAQGGNSAGCPASMGEPVAALINLVVANPTGQGNMQAFAVGGEPGANLGVNFADIGSNRANAGMVKTTLGAGPDITVASRYSSAHAVIDVLGYYYPDGDLLYTPVSPCRIVDTRKAEGIIGAYTERDFHVYGNNATISAQGGNASGCPAPMGEPLAAHINLVAVYPSGKGNMQAYPVSGSHGANLAVNFTAIGTNFANAGAVQTDLGAGPDITVTSRYSSAHTVIDVLGYYYPDGDFTYTPVSPCRIVDTRKTTAGIIGAYKERNFHVFGDSATIGAQGGNSSGCPAPSGEPLAAHINLVVANPTGQGNMQAYAVGGGPGANLGLNFADIETNFVNAGNVQTATGSGPDITVTSRISSAHTVIDVLGYYYPAP